MGGTTAVVGVTVDANMRSTGLSANAVPFDSRSNANSPDLMAAVSSNSSVSAHFASMSPPT